MRLTVTDERRYRAFDTGVALVCALRQHAPERFAFLPGNPPFFDLLAGRGLVRQSIASGCAERTVAEACERDRRRGIEWQTSGRIYTS